MDSNSWRAAQMSSQVISSEAMPDWRTQLQQDSRHRIAYEILETLKRHLPIYGQGSLQEFYKMAIRFEENMYTTATSQSDYLTRISLKMLAIESISRNRKVNSLQSNAAATSQNPRDPAHKHALHHFQPRMHTNEDQLSSRMQKLNIKEDDVDANI